MKHFFPGFTLIELLIVISLLSITTFVAATNMPIIRQKAQDALRKSHLEKIKVALNEYYSDEGCFPPALPACGEKLESGGVTYINSFPCDPVTKDSYVYESDGSSCNSWFKVLTDLTITTDPSIEQVGCQMGCGSSCSYNFGVVSTNRQLDDGCIAYYVCAPGGSCETFADPAKSECPVKFKNDPSCGSVDCSNKDFRCKNSSGKNK